MKTKYKPNRKLKGVILTLFLVFLLGGIISNFTKEIAVSYEGEGESSFFQELTSVLRDWTELSDSNVKGNSQTPSSEVTNVSGKLNVHFIDVGQADSMVIENNGETMVIDAGNNADSDLVVNYIKEMGISDIKYLVGTHPHEDHIGGLDKVIDNFNIGTLYMPKATATTKTFKDVVSSAKAKNLSFTAPTIGQEFMVGEAKCTIIAPNGENYKSANDYSIVIKLQYGETSFLFTGDAEDKSEGEILSKNFDLNSTVLKVSHHGSQTSTTDEFLNKVSPKYAVISVGVDNDYGHPRQNVLDKFKERNIPVYRTDEGGTIVATSDGKEVNFSTSPGSYKGLTKGK